MNKSKDAISISEELIVTMADGNPGAMMIVFNMLSSDEMIYRLLTLNKLNIKGEQIYKLFNDCCDRNDQKYIRTIDMIEFNVFTKEEIFANLNLVRSIPFIDDNIQIKNLTEYDKQFGSNNEYWDIYCKKQKESFINRITPIIENNKVL